jgi:hypothetical protein
MKTKELENIIDDATTGRGRVPVGTTPFLDLAPVSRFPCPVSLVPLNKNEGASGDVYENKGTEKCLTPNARK